MSAWCDLTGRAAVIPYRRIVAVSMFLTFAATGTAQEAKSLLGGGATSGGFGGPTVAFTRIHDDLAVLVGGRGGWIIDHSIVLGGAGFSMVTPDIRTGYSLHGDRPELRLGYGGVESGYIGLSGKLVHPLARLLIGGGHVTYQSHGRGHPSDDFFAAEPALGVEVNMTNWLRIDAGASYRFIIGAGLPGTGDAQLSGFAGALTLAFGRF